MDKMIDLHNHSLPGVDDGAKDFSETIENITFLKEKGITDIVFTSHFICDTKYQVEVSERKKLLEKIKLQYKDDNIHFYLGNEVYVCDSDILLNLLKQEKITTINDSKYLLIEFPLHQSVHHIDKLLCELNDKGIIPIIAHPERYRTFQKDYKKILELLEYNCLLQCNLGSISGQYGSRAKKYMKWLLKQHLVSFISTDFHHIPEKDTFNKALKKLDKIISKEEKENLLYQNAKCVLEDKKVELRNYTV